MRRDGPELRNRNQGNANSQNKFSDTHNIIIVEEDRREPEEYPNVDLEKFTREVKIWDIVVTALLDIGSGRNIIYVLTSSRE